MKLRYRPKNEIDRAFATPLIVPLPTNGQFFQIFASFGIAGTHRRRLFMAKLI